MKPGSWMLSGLSAFGLLAGSVMAQEAKPMPAPAPAAVTPPVIVGWSGGGECCTSPCTSGCFSNCCDNSCENKRGGLIASLEFMFLTPKFSENPAYFGSNASDNIGLPSTTVVSSSFQQDFSYHTQFVPELSFGYIGQSGFGGRITWWGFAESTQQLAITGAPAANGTQFTFAPASPNQIQELTAFPGPLTTGTGSALLVQTKLRMDVWDFEAVQEFSCCHCCCLASGGIRYAHISQDYNAEVVDPDGTVEGTILSGHNFNGAGPTVALEARRVFGNSGLFLYSKGRASVLFGTSSQSAFESSIAEEVDPSGNAVWNANTVIPEGELELGLGIERDTRLGEAFFRLGVVGQIWGNVGSASMSSGFPNFLFGPERDPSAAIDRNAALGLIGFTLAAGLNY